MWQSANVSGAVKIDPISRDDKKLNVLILSPSPGDEILGCGGALARHLLRQDAVRVITLTDGSRGTPSGVRDAQLIKGRESESKQALAVLGEAKVDFWRFENGKLKANPTTLGLLKQIMIEAHVDRIYAPWWGDDNQDHQQTIEILSQSLQAAPQNCEIWQYETSSPLLPNRIVPIDNVFDVKIQAIRKHISQLKLRRFDHAIAGLNDYRGEMHNQKQPAEAFLVLSAKQFSELYGHFDDKIDK
jgi:LmbE family N-acetylglucosaminyl deacetylase